MKIAIEVAISILGIALVFRLWGKSAVQSALLLAAVLLLKTFVAKFFGTTGVILYVAILGVLFTAIYLTKRKLKDNQ
jgi:hypothetical protein